MSKKTTVKTTLYMSERTEKQLKRLAVLLDCESTRETVKRALDATMTIAEIVESGGSVIVQEHEGAPAMEVMFL